MNQKINLDLISLKYIINKDKYYIFPAIVVLVAILLFFKVTIPEYEQYLATREEVKKEQAKLDVLSANLDLLQNTNSEDLKNQLDILVSALPLKKDVVQILSSLYFAAEEADVTLGNFTFSVGNLDTNESKSKSKSKDKDKDKLPTIILTVPIKETSIENVSNFVKIMKETVPLSQADKISVRDNRAKIDLSFYYLLQDPSDYKQTIQLKTVSQEDLMLIDKMKDFREKASVSAIPVSAEPTVSPSVSPTPVATSSASQ